MIYDPVIMTIMGSGSVSQDTSTLLRHGTACLRRWDLALWMSFRTQNWERIMVALNVFFFLMGISFIYLPALSLEV